MIRFITACLLLLPLHSYALTLGVPIDCEFGKNCMIQQYADLDPSGGATDYRCGSLVYDGHKGTDFRLINREEMRKGVNVLAATSGMVRGMRDGMADINFRAPNAPSIKGKECGNGVVITHENGWETQYCHLKKGSINVIKGQKVKAGDVLGQVGYSGSTEFPHLHLSVRKDDKVVDPFIGYTDTPQCGQVIAPLWNQKAARLFTYKSTGIIDVSFSNAAPKYDEIKDGKHINTHISANDPAIIFWVHIYGLQANDRLVMSIHSPSGEELAMHHVTIDRNKAQFFQFIGKKNSRGTFDTGTYIGKVNVLRSDNAGNNQMVISYSTPLAVK